MEPAIGTRGKTTERIMQRVEKLSSKFAYYIEVFDKRQRFSGPSWYFHSRTLERLRQYGVFMDVFDDDLFFEYLYATLTSWGLHRMGSRGAKLVEFQTFVGSIRHQKEPIGSLGNMRLAELTEEEGKTVA